MRLAGMWFVILATGVGGCSHTLRSSAVQPKTVSGPNAVSGMDRQILNAVDAGDGDYQARILRSRLEANPQDLTARLELASHYQRAGFPEIAVEHIRLACERAPESTDAHVALAKILHENGNAAEAVRSLETFAAQGGDERRGDVNVWMWLGLLRDVTGDAKGGEAAHRRAVALAPLRDDLRNNLGYSLLRQGRKEEAAAEFRAALKINSRSLVARNNLGEALTGGNNKDAVLNWQSVTDPASAHNNMAAVMVEAGQYTEARQEIGIALGYNPNHEAALRNLELISRLDGKAAEVAISRPQGRMARLRTAWVHYWTGKDLNKNSGAVIASRLE